MFLFLVLIVLHTPDGSVVHVNPEQVTALRPERNARESERMYTKGAKCLISLTDGKGLAVVEDCDAVQRAIDGK